MHDKHFITFYGYHKQLPLNFRIDKIKSTNRKELGSITKVAILTTEHTAEAVKTVTHLTQYDTTHTMSPIMVQVLTHT